MPTVRDVLNAVERLAPSRYAFSFDHIGLQIGDPSDPVTGVVTTLDCSHGAIDHALVSGANVIVSHHPVIFDALASVRSDDPRGALVVRLVKAGIAVIVAHTNWDCAPGGVNDALAAKLGLLEVRPFGSASDSRAFKVVTFAPVDSADTIVDAMSEEGAGNIGLYDRCAFVGQGTGTFRGGDGSRPTVGESGKVESVQESRIEMVVPTDRLKAVVDTMKRTHPYEEPAYDVVPLETGNGHSIGRIGQLAGEMNQEEFLEHVSRSLGTQAQEWCHSEARVRTVAVVGGAADSEWSNALDSGAQAFVTGEVKHHIALEASAAGLLMVQAGHFATEHPGMVAMRDALVKALSAVKVSVFEPEPGRHGRPCSPAG